MDPDTIKRAMNGIDWDREFGDLNVDQCVFRLTEYVVNIFQI